MNQNTQLYDIYGMWHVPFWQTKWFIACVCTALVVALMLAFFALRKKKKSLPEEPWRVALHALSELEVAGFIEAGESKSFYDRLTRIIKQYLHEQCALNVLSKSDDEVCALVAERAEFRQISDELQQIFAGVVFIKFAHDQTTEQQMRDALAAGRLCIEKTRASDKHHEHRS